MQITLGIVLALLLLAPACDGETRSQSKSGEPASPAVSAPSDKHAGIAGKGPGHGRGGKQSRHKPQQDGGETELIVRDCEECYVLLGCPAADSIVVSVLLDTSSSCRILYGLDQSALSSESSSFETTPDQPLLVNLTGLNPNSRYYYKLQQIKASGPATDLTEVHSFETACPAGIQFSFALQADPHLDEHTDAATYEKTLANILAARPDFLLDLGDTFMLDKLGDPDDEVICSRLRSARSFYAQCCSDVPLLQVLGNHDAELGWMFDGSADNLAVRACRQRLAWYPAPLHEGFYHCAPEPDPVCGQRGGYYSFEWGDALLVTLDPFWYTESKARHSEDNWDWTLGHEQYDWLARTLASSQARHKLVFIHHLVGGSDHDGRGGIEAAPFYEWGGRNADGSAGFSRRRPDWGKPIHELLRDNGVEAVFHGHDHFYCRQELDGIVYQLVPQPGSPEVRTPRQAEDYGYQAGETLGGGGFLLLTVSRELVKVEFMRTRASGTGSEVAAVYELGTAKVPGGA